MYARRPAGDESADEEGDGLLKASRYDDDYLEHMRAIRRPPPSAPPPPPPPAAAVFAEIFAGPPVGHAIRDSVKCFSCMSKIYEAVWPALSPIYKRPLNFTDACDTISGEAAAAAAAADESGGPSAAHDDGFIGGGRRRRPAGASAPQRVADVPVVQCSTICVGMWEETNVAGVRIRAHIRGCMDDLLHAGFNETIVTLFRWLQRDSCRDYRKRELLKLPADGSPARSTAGGGEDPSGALHVCTCYADYCNAAGAASAAAVSPRFSTLLGVFSLMALWLRYNAGLR